MTKNPSNPFGVFGDAIQPRPPKNKLKGSAKAVVTLVIAPQDSSEWAERLLSVDKAVKAFTEHVNKDKDVKFIKRKFFLNAVENHIAKYLADNPDCIIK